MNFHIYVANPRFEDDPIAKGDWVAALEKVASKNEKLVIERKTNKRSGEVFIWGRLRDSKSQQLELDPYGLIHAQNPSRALIEVMFEIATELGLKVYSERSKPYLIFGQPQRQGPRQPNSGGRRHPKPIATMPMITVSTKTTSFTTSKVNTPKPSMTTITIYRINICVASSS